MSDHHPPSGGGGGGWFASLSVPGKIIVVILALMIGPSLIHDVLQAITCSISNTCGGPYASAAYRPVPQVPPGYSVAPQQVPQQAQSQGDPSLAQYCPESGSFVQQGDRWYMCP